MALFETTGGVGVTMRNLVIGAMLTFAVPAHAADVLTRPSSGSVTETLDRLQRQVLENGFTVFARAPHSAGAAGVGMELRPTEVLIFGNPKGGTPLMACDQRVGLDLPLRALAWQDAGGKVWLTMPDPETFKSRYALKLDCDGPIQAMRAGIDRLMDKAIEP